MAKTIVKEIIIMLLLCLAIILVLGVLLYDYVPMAKVIPETVLYAIPETVQKELLEAGGIDESKVILTYEIDSKDLNNYKRVQSYKAGKANPFSSYEPEVEEQENGTTSGNNNTTNSNTASSNKNTNTTTNTIKNNTTSNNTNNTTSSETQNSSGGKYFQDKGTK